MTKLEVLHAPALKWAWNCYNKIFVAEYILENHLSREKCELNISLSYIVPILT
jgi:hypothetical protein